jgi:hypothetical protein
MKNKVLTIIKLLINFFYRKRVYNLRFIKEGDNWFYDFKNWGFEHGNLMMVCGADKLCDWFSANGEARIRVVVSRRKLKNMEDYEEYKGEKLWSNRPFDRFMYGRDYQSQESDERRFWICPVTLFVLGRYPNYIYLPKKC